MIPNEDDIGVIIHITKDAEAIGLIFTQDWWIIRRTSPEKEYE